MCDTLTLLHLLGQAADLQLLPLSLYFVYFQSADKMNKAYGYCFADFFIVPPNAIFTTIILLYKTP